MRLRQVALVARELETAVADLCAVLGIEVAYRDPGVKVFGLHNAIMPVGDTFLEVVSPIAPGTTAGRYLEHRGGDGGYMVILQSDDLEADRRRAAELGVRIVWETTLPDIETIHLHPKDVGGAILSLDVARPPQSWRWAGPQWARHVRTHVADSIAGVALQASDPETMATRWSRVLDRPAIREGEDTFELPLDRGTIRFISPGDARGDGLAELEVLAANPEQILEVAESRGLRAEDDGVDVAGIRIRLA